MDKTFIIIAAVLLLIGSSIILGGLIFMIVIERRAAKADIRRIVPFCTDCPDREGCSQGIPCEEARKWL